MDLFGIFNAVKGFITGFIVRWLMMIGGVLFAQAGISEAQITEAVSGLLMILVSIGITLWQHRKAVSQTPTN